MNKFTFSNFKYMYSPELCALVNKPSGASAGASDLKYKRRYRELYRFQKLAALAPALFMR